MARKNRRNRPGQGGGNWQSSGYHHYNNSDHHRPAADYNDTILCNHCDVKRPRFRFPKVVIERYEKKLARGEDPASIRSICRDCCKPETSASGALANDRPAPPRLAPFDPGRGRCTRCLTEYPLTTKFFTKRDTRLNAPNRTCFTCKNNEVLDDVEAPDGYEIEFDDIDPDEPIHLYDIDHDEREEAMHRNFEDLDEQAKKEAERARIEFGNLTIKISDALQLAQRRRRLRFRPVIERLRDQQLQDTLQQLTYENNLPESDFDRLQTTTVTRRDQEEINVEPEFPNVIQRWRAIARTVISDLVQAEASHSASTASDDQDDDEEDRKAEEHLEYLRLPDHEREEFLRNRQVSNAVKSERQRYVEVYTGNAEQVAHSETERLADLIDRSLAISETALHSHRRLIPTFDVAAFSQRFLNDRASARASSAPSTSFTVNTGLAVAASTSAAASISAAASTSTSGSSSTPASRPSLGSASPQPTKRPRVVQRETPVDPRRALFAHRYPQAQNNAQTNPTQQPQQQQQQQAGSTPTIKVEAGDTPSIKVERF